MICYQNVYYRVFCSQFYSPDTEVAYITESNLFVGSKAVKFKPARHDAAFDFGSYASQSKEAYTYVFRFSVSFLTLIVLNIIEA